MTNFTCHPVIIIGAARSGTKLLRDTIARHPSVERVPYDVNYIWRLGNENMPHDELSPKQLTPEIQLKIRQEILKYGAESHVMVEKTVSNCLRVSFVRAVFPEAKFIHLIRDGRDVTESVYRQWIAPTDWLYILRKTLSYPILKAPGYALSYFTTLTRRSVHREKNKRGVWGPRYEGIDEDVESRDLWEVCAIQWVRSVKRALTEFGELQPEDVYTIRYEDFVKSPSDYLEEIALFANLDPMLFRRIDLTNIAIQNIGKGTNKLSPDQISHIMPIIANTLNLLGYQS